LDLDTFINIILGSTLGLILRLFIRYSFKKNTSFYFNNFLIVNILSSLFLGFFVALGIINKNLFLFYSVGFLGCFSTFSSFIYQLFDLIHKREYISLIIYYVEVLVLSFLFFGLGYFISLMIKS
tara:strand:- start:34 stop:405 length:372 start_codon:yes stop_codon:yes gene_type:complete